MTDRDTAAAVQLLHEITQTGQCVEFEFGVESRWCLPVAEGWQVVHECYDGEVRAVTVYQRPGPVASLVSASEGYSVRSRHEWPTDPIPEPFDPRGNVASVEARR